MKQDIMVEISKNDPNKKKLPLFTEAALKTVGFKLKKPTYRRSITFTPLYFVLSKAKVLPSTGTFGVNSLIVKV